MVSPIGSIVKNHFLSVTNKLDNTINKEVTTCTYSNAPLFKKVYLVTNEDFNAKVPDNVQYITFLNHLDYPYTKYQKREIPSSITEFIDFSENGDGSVIGYVDNGKLYIQPKEADMKMVFKTWDENLNFKVPWMNIVTGEEKDNPRILLVGADVEENEKECFNPEYVTALYYYFSGDKNGDYKRESALFATTKEITGEIVEMDNKIIAGTPFYGEDSTEIIKVSDTLYIEKIDDSLYSDLLSWPFYIEDYTIAYWDISNYSWYK